MRTVKKNIKNENKRSILYQMKGLNSINVKFTKKKKQPKTRKKKEITKIFLISL